MSTSPKKQSPSPAGATDQSGQRSVPQLQIPPIQQMPGFSEITLLSLEEGALTVELRGGPVFLRSAEQRLHRRTPASLGEDAVSLKAQWSRMLDNTHMVLRCRIYPVAD